MQIGFIGLGTMGASMAANLQTAGHKIIVHDVRREAAKGHIANGARWANSPRELGEECDVVFTSLPGPPEVEAVALGKDGLLAGMRQGSAFFDLSTNSRAVMQKIGAAFAEKGVHVLDAPVSGGPKGALTGKLAIWVGGDRDVFERHKPVLDAIGDQARYVGPIGQASVAKVVHNMAGYAIQTALAEVFTMGVKAGVDPLVLWESVRQGAQGRRRTFDGLVDQFLPNKYDPPAFALKLAHKDVSLATALGREVGVPMRLCNLVLEEMTEARARGWDNLDSRVPMRLQVERANVKIEVDPQRIAESISTEAAAAGGTKGG